MKGEILLVFILFQPNNVTIQKEFGNLEYCEKGAQKIIELNVPFAVAALQKSQAEVRKILQKQYVCIELGKQSNDKE